jgi:pimeloyl-ACP methyl ester carboxylesterase
MTELQPLDGSVLPAGIRARFVERVNGLRVHILEAGEPGRPCLLLQHGFPELAYSWRKIMGTLAAAGYHVVAPDLRGSRAAALFRQDHRRAVNLHLGQQRLGCLPAPRRDREDERHRLHGNDRRPLARRRRALGATGAA